MNSIIPQHLNRNYFLNLLLPLLLLSFTISTNLFGQVVIEEKIEIITPYQSNLKKSINTIASGSQTVRFEIDWDKPNRDGFIRVIYPSSKSDNYSNWTSGGSLSLTVGGFVAPVNIMFQYKVNLGAYEPSLVRYRMFVDDELVKAGSSTLTGGWTSIPYRNVTYLLEKKLETILYVKADFETETLSPGDTVNVIVKKVDEEGNENNFSPSTNFEVGLEEGCGAGYILDAAGQPQDYISSIQRPIKFVVNNNLTEADTLIKLRVGVPDGVDTVYKPYSEFPLLPRVNPGTSEKKKLNQEPLTALESEYCTAIFDHFGYGTAKGKIEDDCEEAIVECTDFEPQVFDVNSIEVLGENQEWQWIDEQGNLQTTNTGNACKFKQQANCDSVEYGKTYLMNSIGDYSTDSLPVYNLLDDIDISTCLDTSDVNTEYWQFNVSNLRIPIFVDKCLDQPNICKKVDLGNGTNSSILSAYIGDCKSYRKIMDVVDWWKKGPYWNKADSIGGYNIYFSPGIMPHENVHLNQLRDETLPKFMNNQDSYGFPGIRELNLRKDDYPCPEDVMQQQEEIVKKFLIFTLNTANDLKTALGTHKNGQSNSELKADEGAMDKYDEIKKNITRWAEKQTWWNPKCNPK